MKKTSLFLILVLMVVGLFSGCTSESAKQLGDPNKKAILVVSFGTSYQDTREKTIEAIESKFVSEFPEYDIVRAFTSQIIIDVLNDRDKIEVMNITEAMEYLKSERYSEVVIQPTLVMNGAEYDDVVNEAMAFEEDFASIKIGSAILTSTDDFMVAIDALKKHMPSRNENQAVVLMGHGTHHHANAVYAALDYMLEEQGANNVFVGTVEAYPTFDNVLKKLEQHKIEEVTLMPFMIVSGDHAENDMAGDESGSWKTMLKKSGYVVNAEMVGLGEMQEIQDLIVEHAKDAILGEEKGETTEE